MKGFCCWSGGKDAAIALYEAEKTGVQICYLVNMVSLDGKHSRSHGLSSQLLKVQSEAMEIPIIQKAVTRSYEVEFKEVIAGLKDKDVHIGVFGDIDVQEHRDWVERVCTDVGIKPIFPLWDKKRKLILKEFFDNKFKAIIVSLKSDALSEDYLGRELDEKFIMDIRKLQNIDLCGENGEYHSLVYNGPIFKKRLNFDIGERILKNKRWFLQVSPHKDKLKGDFVEQRGAIVILAHGSRNSQAKEEFLKMVNLVQEKLPSCRIEPAYFQFSEDNLPNVLKKLAQEGCKKIRIIPTFLFKGVHMQKDIPEVISSIKKDLPDLEISLSTTLWPDKRISDIIVERITEEPGC